MNQISNILYSDNLCHKTIRLRQPKNQTVLLYSGPAPPSPISSLSSCPMDSVHHPDEEVDQLHLIHQVGVTSQVLISFAPCQVLLVLLHFLVACLLPGTSSLNARFSCALDNSQPGPTCGSSLPRFSLLNTMCHFSHILSNWMTGGCASTAAKLHR